MQRSKGISQAEKVLLRFDRIPRLGIQISLRKPARHRTANQNTQPRRIEKQQVSEILRQDAYRFIQTPR